MSDASSKLTETSEAQRKRGQIIEKSLSSRGYKFSPTGTDGVLSLNFQGRKFEIQAAIFFGEGFLTIQAALPILIPEHALSKVLVRINELNTVRPIGGFEVHSATKKLAFKVGVNLPPELNDEELESLLMLAVSSADSVADEIFEYVSSNAEHKAVQS